MLTLKEVEENYFEGKPAIDCCGLLSGYFAKHPDVDLKEKYDNSFIQSLVDSLLIDVYVSEKFPAELRLIFKDPAYDKVLTNLNIDKCELLSTSNKDYFVLIIKR